jgi:hypothetical protein
VSVDVEKPPTTFCADPYFMRTLRNARLRKHSSDKIENLM